MVANGKKYFNNSSKCVLMCQRESKFMAKRIKIKTTTGGNPVADKQNSITAGPRGPLPMQDHQLLEKLAHQNRELISERMAHAKGTAAFGMLTITHDITESSTAVRR